MFLLEILAIDKNPSHKPTIIMPDLNVGEFLFNASIWITSVFIFFFFARLIFYIFKLAVAGTDEENIETAKNNIKGSIIFLFISSISWVVLSAFYQGVTINL